jgi:hypothetical protein
MSSDRSAKKMKTSGIVAVITASLLVISFWVFLRGASDEPYTTFRASDAVVQIGVASALMALWVVLIGFITAQVAKKKLHPAWLSVFILCALAVFGLYQSPAGYISDLIHFGVVVR